MGIDQDPDYFCNGEEPCHFRRRDLLDWNNWNRNLLSSVFKSTIKAKGFSWELFNNNFSPDSMSELLIRSAYCVFYCDSNSNNYFDVTLCPDN